jgi:cytochrome P450
MLEDAACAPADAVRAWKECYDYVCSLVALKRSDPTNDVVSFRAGEHGLSDEEIADTCLVLFQGGIDTTGDMLAVAAFALLCHNDQMKALREDPSIAKTAVEELLRYAGVFRLTDRPRNPHVHRSTPWPGETKRLR